ncbi:MAG: ABC-F family ATP-binding cassette domain-containing protein, partial [Alphaproteobacteria bacterium]|nr:ABC-F family ATP-binding cassette domain-containing protein [Alphaproteobacteria bacterium]
MIYINNLTYRIGGRVLLNDTSVHIAKGQRVGLVGRNGSGKTTLLHLLLKELEPENGEIIIRSNSIGHVKQEISDTSVSLIDYVLAADIERSELLAELESSTVDGHRIAEIHERLMTINAHAAPSRAATILSGLGFEPESQKLPLKEFSGGWRMRVSLAAVLFVQSDLLLLDEPTNHLDLEATIWLENFLARYQGTLLIVSHDRDILNKACNRIVHIEKQSLISYGGNFNKFERTRRMKAELQVKASVKQQKKREKIQKFIDRFRSKATKAKQAQSRIKMLENMETIIPIIEEKAISFDFPEPEELAPPIIALENGVAGYDGKPVLSNLDFSIDMDDRIALLGANGNGKSTLAKILSGKLALMSGEMRHSKKLRVGYFAQHQTEALDMEGTPFTHLEKLMPKAIPSAVRAQAGRFGFQQERGEVKVRNLSGGEKARLLFAIMCRANPNILILDEPTNHLDIETTEWLEDYLDSYPGAVIMVSHDRYLLDKLTSKIVEIEATRSNSYSGNYSVYLE